MGCWCLVICDLKTLSIGRSSSLMIEMNSWQQKMCNLQISRKWNILYGKLTISLLTAKYSFEISAFSPVEGKIFSLCLWKAKNILLWNIRVLPDSKDCRLPVQLQRAMAAEAEAAREARAKVLMMMLMRMILLVITEAGRPTRWWSKQGQEVVIMIWWWSKWSGWWPGRPEPRWSWSSSTWWRSKQSTWWRWNCYLGGGTFCHHGMTPGLANVHSSTRNLQAFVKLSWTWPNNAGDRCRWWAESCQSSQGRKFALAWMSISIIGQNWISFYKTGLNVNFWYRIKLDLFICLNKTSPRRNICYRIKLNLHLSATAPNLNLPHRRPLMLLRSLPQPFSSDICRWLPSKYSK